jgi:hypothetical protein
LTSAIIDDWRSYCSSWDRRSHLYLPGVVDLTLGSAWFWSNYFLHQLLAFLLEWHILFVY